MYTIQIRSHGVSHPCVDDQLLLMSDPHMQAAAWKSYGSMRALSSCLPHPLPLPDCGNLQCETGEECVDAACTGGDQCRADCPYVRLACPAGAIGTGSASPPSVQTPCSQRGVCSSATGTCACYKGYIGPACNVCDSQYVAIGAACVMLPGALVSGG